MHRLPCRRVIRTHSSVKVAVIMGISRIDDGTTAAGVGDLALSSLILATSMAGSKVVQLVVGSFKDVKFSIVRPWSTSKSPERRPGPATFHRSCWHFGEVTDDQTFGPAILSFDPDTLASNIVLLPVSIDAIGRRDQCCCRIDLHLGHSRADFNEIVVLGIIPISIGDISMCWVPAIEEGEIIEKGLALIVLVQSIILGSRNSRNQRQSRNECGARPQKE